MSNELGKASLFDNRYTILKTLGQGGMGVVYLAQDGKLADQLVALKVLAGECIQNKKSKERFTREVLLARKVSHPNIVRTHDLGEGAEGLYLTMEFVEGHSLKDIVAARPLDWHRAMDVLFDVAAGLQAIHQAGIVHRDLKSANIIITPDGIAKISDFGIASRGDSSITSAHELLGSSHYMAPELWTGAAATIQSDLYALGVLAYEMICGIYPFDGATNAELMYKHLQQAAIAPLDVVELLPVGLNNLILDLLAKNPASRPASIVDVIVRLQAIWDNPMTEIPIEDLEEDELLPEEPAYFSPDSKIKSLDSASAGYVPIQASEQVISEVATSEGDIVRATKRPSESKVTKVFAPVFFAALYVLMLAILSGLAPELVAELRSGTGARKGSLSYLLAGILLLATPICFGFFQYLFLTAVASFFGNGFSLMRAFRMCALNLVITTMLCTYYLTIILRQWLVMHGKFSFDNFLFSFYQSSLATALNSFEILSWNLLPSGFSATKIVGMKPTFDLHESLPTMLIPTLLGVLLFVGVAFMMKRSAPTSRTYSVTLTLLICFVFLALNVGYEYVASLSLAEIGAIEKTEFSPKSFFYSFHDYVFAALAFVIFSILALGKRQASSVNH